MSRPAAHLERPQAASRAAQGVPGAAFGSPGGVLLERLCSWRRNLWRGCLLLRPAGAYARDVCQDPESSSLAIDATSAARHEAVARLAELASAVRHGHSGKAVASLRRHAVLAGSASGRAARRKPCLARSQISRAILDEQQRFKPPKWLEEAKQPVTKEELEEKIDQLHAAINDVASQTAADGASTVTK